MRVDFYGQLADRLSARCLDIDLGALPSGQALRAALAEDRPEIADILHHPGTRLMLDDEITDWNSNLSAAQTIAILPVVSGG